MPSFALSALLICSITLCSDFNYCSSQTTASACPTGSYCTSLSSSFTYSCTCFSNYSMSGTLSSSPYIQQCSATSNTVVVVLAILIPIVAGVAIFFVTIFLVFVVRTFRIFVPIRVQYAIRVS